MTQMTKEEKKSLSADSAPKHLRNCDLALTFLDEHLFKKDFVSSHSKMTICLFHIYIIVIIIWYVHAGKAKVVATKQSRFYGLTLPINESCDVLAASGR